MQDQSLSPLQTFFRNKWVILTFVVDAIVIIVLVVLLIFNSMKKSVLTLNVVPWDSQISVNGHSGYTNGSYRLLPGTYEVTISHPDLNSKTFVIDLSKHDVGTITTFLSGDDSNFDFYRLKSNLGAFLNLAQIASANGNQTTDKDTSAEAFIDVFQKNYLLYSNNLPIEYIERDATDPENTLSENITIRNNPNCKITLCLKALMFGTDDKELVNTLLINQGFDVEEFEIEYQIY